MNIAQWWRGLTGRSTLNSTKNLPKLPEDIDDNFYLASASRAGEIDRLSGAYDEFLFSEDGLDKMPFESSVDHHLALAEIRLKDRGRRSYLSRQDDLFRLKGKVATSKYREQQIEERILSQNARLEEQKEILAGEKTGRAGLKWAGSIPETTSLFSAFIGVLLPIVTFIFVGLVDIGIIIVSFTSIPGFKEADARLFALPAVGVQLVFPHLIGDRINLLVHGYKKRLFAFLAILFLGAVWLSFVVVLTEVRMYKIITDAADAGESMSALTNFALYVGNIIMLVGLGTWLLALAAKSNHHQHEYRRVDLGIRLSTRKLEQTKRKTVALETKVPAMAESLEVIHQSYSDAVSTSRNELAEAAKSVYRRSLINQFGSVEFTSSFLGADGSATPERIEKKKKIESRNASSPLFRGKRAETAVPEAISEEV